MDESGNVAGGFKIDNAGKVPKMTIFTQTSLMKLKDEHVLHLCNLFQQINHSTHIY